MNIRKINRKTVRPASDYETVPMSIETLHHVMSLGDTLDPRNAPGGFLRGNGAPHVKRCSCDSCKLRRHYLRNRPRNPANLRAHD